MTNLRIEIPEKLLPLMQPMRHKVIRGGRGGAKSHTVGSILLARGVEKKIRWLCAREVQKSIADSVHKLLSDKIRELKLSAFYEVLRDSIKGENGTEFLFAGLQDHTVDSIKSYEGCDGAWIEEAHSISERSAEVLIPTIRKAGSELWWTFNPNSPLDYVYHRFITIGDPNAIVIEINWRDNPWFPAELELERQQLMRTQPSLYEHVYEGKCKSAAGIIFKREWFNRFPAKEKPVHLRNYGASDYALSKNEGDYTEHGIAGMDQTGEVWIHDWWTGREEADVSIDAFLSLVGVHKPRTWYGEAGVIEKALGPTIRKQMRDSNRYVHRELLPTIGDKATRADGFRAMSSTGVVHIQEGDWGDRLIDQLAMFAGQKDGVDDKVDVCGLFGRAIDQMRNAVVHKPAERETIKPFTRKWLEYDPAKEINKGYHL